MHFPDGSGGRAGRWIRRTPLALAPILAWLVTPACVAEDEMLDYSVAITVTPQSLRNDGADTAEIGVSVTDQNGDPPSSGALTLLALDSDGLTGHFPNSDTTHMTLYLDAEGVGMARFRCTEVGTVFIRVEATFLIASGTAQLECVAAP
jgi:hypothetical protein